MQQIKIKTQPLDDDIQQYLIVDNTRRGHETMKHPLSFSSAI